MRGLSLHLCTVHQQTQQESLYFSVNPSPLDHHWPRQAWRIRRQTWTTRETWPLRWRWTWTGRARWAQPRRRCGPWLRLCGFPELLEQWYRGFMCSRPMWKWWQSSLHTGYTETQLNNGLDDSRACIRCGGKSLNWWQSSLHTGYMETHLSNSLNYSHARSELEVQF